MDKIDNYHVVNKTKIPNLWGVVGKKIEIFSNSILHAYDKITHIFITSINVPHKQHTHNYHQMTYTSCRKLTNNLKLTSHRQHNGKIIIHKTINPMLPNCV